MQAVSRVLAFALMGFLLSLPVLGADDKDKKADPPKGDVKKSDVKKDEPAKQDAKKDEPVKQDAKKDEPAKKDADKKDAKKPANMPKLPARKGQFKQYEDNPEAATKKMMKSPKVQGTVVAVAEDKKVLRLRVPIHYVKINEGHLQNYINAQNSMLQATNAQGVVNAQRSMAQAAAQIYEIATVEKEAEWTATDEVKVRMNNPPPQFDEKGRPKRYTAQQLRELKGNDKLPGYPAEFSDLKNGQIVQVTLLQKKTGARPVRRGKDAEGEAADDLPKMQMIIIMAEPRN
jgi:hypothetical protein